MKAAAIITLLSCMALSQAIAAFPRFLHVETTTGNTQNSTLSLHDPIVKALKQGANAIFITAAGPMNGTGGTKIVVKARNRNNTGQSYDWTQEIVTSQYQGAAIVFTAIEVEGFNKIFAKWAKFESTGWNFYTWGGNSTTAAMAAVEQASKKNPSTGYINIANIQVTYEQTVNPIGFTQGSTEAFGAPYRIPPPPEPDKPDTQNGAIRLNKAYQRQGLWVRGDAWVNNSVQMRVRYKGTNGEFNANILSPYPIPAAANPRRIPANQPERYEFAVTAPNFSTVYRLEANNGSGNWSNIDTVRLTFYTPEIDVFGPETADKLAKLADGIHRTRLDTHATFVNATSGFVDTGDPGEKMTNVYIYKPGDTSWGYRLFNENGQAVGNYSDETTAARAFYNLTYNGSVATGFPVNTFRSMDLNPQTFLSGSILSAVTSANAPVNFRFGTSFKGVRNQNHWSNLQQNTAVPWHSSSNFQVVPLASGTISFGGGGSTSFTQGETKTPNITISSPSTTVTANITNQYPNSFSVLAVGPADGIAEPVQVATNYPAGGSQLTANLSTYFNGKPAGHYWVYLLGYTPLDRRDLGNVVDSRLVVTFSGNNPKTSGGDIWNHPTKGSYPYGWVNLASIRFYYSGTVDVKASIITDK